MNLKRTDYFYYVFARDQLLLWVNDSFPQLNKILR